MTRAVAVLHGLGAPDGDPVLTPEQLRPADVVELWPGTPQVVLSAVADPEQAATWRLLVIDADRDVCWQVVPADTLYRLVARGPRGRAADRLARFR